MGYGHRLWKTIGAFCVFFSSTFASGRAAEPSAAIIDVTRPLLNVLQPVQTLSDSEQDGSLDSVEELNEQGREVIRERYPNRMVKIAREVVQDAQGNYVNHGSWTSWDVKGNLIAEGEYRYGRRQGMWTRSHHASDSKLFATEPYSQFPSPFISQAEFQNGKLNGKWTILDAKKRMISDWQFADGTCDGQSLWFFPNGQKMRSIIYEKGIITSLSIWNADATLVHEGVFHNGRHLQVKVAYYKGTQQKQTEGSFLAPRIVQKSEADWWGGLPPTYSTEGKEDKHGSWMFWHPNGQVALDGKFEFGIPVGRFTWWYANGQRALEGIYDNGQPMGRWIWWHENGQKKSEGGYASGTPTGPWSTWQEDGRLTHRADFSDLAVSIANRPKGPKEVTSATKEPTPAAPKSGKN